MPLGDGDGVAGMEDFFLHADAVDLDAVGAAQVADGPVSVLEGQLAVQAGDVGKAHGDITRFPPAYGQGRPNQGNGFSAPNRNELPVAWLTHPTTSGPCAMPGTFHFPKSLKF